MPSVRLIAAGLFAMLVGSTAWAAACDGFTDVDSSSGFCVNVAWLKSHNITLGCTATTYCPNDAVTRLQMAAFLNRLGNITYLQGGNAFGATAVLGSTDNHPVEIMANGIAGFRILPNADSPQIIAGYVNNGAYPGVRGATIAGGGAPNAEFDSCKFAYGCQNSVTDDYGTIGGGAGNLAGDTDGTLTNSSFATIAGGQNNGAGALASIGGGGYNVATGLSSVIAGGFNNQASGSYSAIGGGGENTATGVDSVVAGGHDNQASGTTSFIAGGTHNVAGAFSFVSGNSENGNATGCVIFGNGFPTTMTCGDNQFLIGAIGGVYIFSSPGGAGVSLPSGAGAWSTLSDRNAKSHIDSVDPQNVLARLAAMPVSTWQWNSEPGAIQHMGPMAQDFYAAFGLGGDDKHITTVDEEGVALAAIQGLNAKLEAVVAEQTYELATQAHELAEIKAQLAAMAATH